MKKIYPVALAVLAVLTLLSLALNVASLAAVLWLRQVLLQSVADTRALVANVKDETFSYTVAVNQDIPVETSVPFEAEVLVPFKTTLPIETTVTVPIDLGFLGVIPIDIPIRTLVPVDMEVAVPISQTVKVVTTVPLDLEVPIEIAIADTPLGEHLDEADAALAQMEQQLANPFGGGK